MERYEHTSRLGEGISSVVYKAKDRHRNELVALKTIMLENVEEGVPSTALREIAILGQLNHPGVVSLHDVVHQNKQLVIALEYVEFNLRQYADQYPPTPRDICNIMGQLFTTMEYCHDQNVIHRDLKPHNILINRNMEVKVADFGLSREMGIHVRSCTYEVVTLWYRPPDVLCGNMHYGFSVDLWSLGCIMAELASVKSTPPFTGSDEIETLKKIFQLLGTPPNEDWEKPDTYPLYKEKTAGFEVYPRCPNLPDQFPALKKEGVDLLLECWRYDPKKRITASQATNHRYFGQQLQAQQPSSTLNVVDTQDV